jgi:hypothetical protein
MRLLLNMTILCGTIGLFGCNHSPASSSETQRMLTPEELEQAKQDIETVEQAERAHLSQFSRRK